MSSKPKILYLVTQSDLGGAQRYVLTLARAAQERFQISVAAGSDGSGALRDECKASQIPFITLPHLRRKISPVDDLIAIKEIRSLIRTHRPEIVHSNSSKAGVLSALAMIGMDPRPKLVYTVHGWVFQEPLSWFKKSVYSWLERIARRVRDMIIVLSKMERDVALKGKYATENKIRVIPLGIKPMHHDKEFARKKLHEMGVPNDVTIIGCVANFYKTKNLLTLVRAFNAITSKHRGMHLVLIGDGPERSAIEKEIKEYSARIHLLGYRGDARALMDGFDLFVLPSVKEGLPYTLLEAMDASLPCLATPVGGIPQVIAHGMNGWLVEPEKIKDGIVTALEKKNEWPRVGAAAHETVAHLFQENKMVNATLSEYQSMINT